MTTRKQNPIKLTSFSCSSSLAPLRYNTNLNPKTNILLIKTDHQTATCNGYMKRESKLQVWETRALCIQLYYGLDLLRGWKPFLYNKNNPSDTKKKYIYIHTYIPSLLLSISMGERELMWNIVIGNVVKWLAGEGSSYCLVCYPNPTRGSRMWRGQNIQ